MLNKLSTMSIIFLTLFFTYCTYKKEPIITKTNNIKLVNQKGINIETCDKIVLRDTELFVLSSMWHSIYTFDKNGDLLKEIALPIGKGPGEFSRYGVRSFDVKDNRIVILDSSINRISFIDQNGTYIVSFIIDFNAFDVKFLNNNEILLLGKAEEKIFQVFNYNGKLIKRFGDQIVENPNLCPTCISINNDTIYVSSVKGYIVYTFVNRKRKEVIKGKRKLIGYKFENNAISFPSGINGLASNDEFLFVSTYNAEKQEFYLDIFSLDKNKLLRTMDLKRWGKVSCIDNESNLLLLRSGFVEFYSIE